MYGRNREKNGLKVVNCRVSVWSKELKVGTVMVCDGGKNIER